MQNYTGDDFLGIMEGNELVIEADRIYGDEDLDNGDDTYDLIDNMPNQADTDWGYGSLPDRRDVETNAKMHASIGREEWGSQIKWETPEEIYLEDYVNKPESLRETGFLLLLTGGATSQLDSPLPGPGDVIGGVIAGAGGIILGIESIREIYQVICNWVEMGINNPGQPWEGYTDGKIKSELNKSNPKFSGFKKPNLPDPNNPKEPGSKIGAIVVKIFEIISNTIEQTQETK